MESPVQRELRVAIRAGDLDSIRACVRDGADLNATNENGHCSLHCAEEHFAPLATAAMMNSAPAIRSLVAAGADVNIKVSPGSPPLHTAAHIGGIDAVRELIAAGADANALGNDGNPPLHGAIIKGDDEIVKALVAAGGDINYSSEEGGGLVSVACLRGHANMVRLLADLGADCSESGSHRPLCIAVAVTRPERPALLEAFAEAGVDITYLCLSGHRISLLHTVAASGDEASTRVICKAMLDKGVSLYTKDEHGRTALQTAGDDGVRRVLELEMNYERRRPFLRFLSGCRLLSAAPSLGGLPAPAPRAVPGAARVFSMRNMLREIMAFL